MGVVLILVLNNELEFFHSSMLLRHLAKVWRQVGFNVIVSSDINKKIEADIVFSHVDLTCVPNEFREFLSQYPVVINGGLNDISKSIFSKNLLQKDSDFIGSVIVKTDANYGGVPEQHVKDELGVVPAATAQTNDWRYLQYIDSHNYPIFNSIDDVPSGVWQNSKLIVERFLAEKDTQGHYCVRAWYCFGDRSMGMLQTSNNPIVKFAKYQNKIITDVPHELELMREEMNVDYARFDYAIVDGETIIYDVNKTPVIGNSGLAILSDELAFFSKGLKTYLE